MLSKKERSYGKGKILNQAQNEGNQEYENFMHYRILTKGVFIIIVLAAIIFVIRVIHAEVYDLKQAPTSDSLILIAGYTSFVEFYAYLHNKKIEYLIISLLIFFMFTGFSFKF